MELLSFLIGVVVISVSGVMMPGPVMATTIAMGSRNRYAGALIAVGHGIVEFPLMVLIVLGAARLLNSDGARIVIGIAGGAVLLVMAYQMLGAMRDGEHQQAEAAKGTPVTAGIVLSAGNPYFLIWWATIGLGLATKAGNLGVWAFVLFALAHWFCDFFWLCAISWASYKGSTLMGPRCQKIVLGVCGAVVLVFGVLFLGGACVLLVKVVRAYYQN